MSEKIIVTNFTALTAKYKATGLKKVKTVLNALVVADKKRGVTTKVVAIDSAAAMKKHGGKAVMGPGDARGTKAAIDAIYAHTQPDYLMILGAPDVVCHQSLLNPVYGDADYEDPDPKVPSDLPYACDAAYSNRITSFTGPTRVVGRLPDVTGGTDPAYLIGLLKTAAQARPKAYADYARYLGISAKVWQVSTTLSIENVFGDPSRLKIAPPSGPKWSGAELDALSHFINCHGGHADPQYYGQKLKGEHGEAYPIAHLSSWIAGKVQPGTVASVECCYAAELYDAPTLDLDVPIVNAYLGDGAYGFFGSSTVAYGPEDSNDQADIICQVFLLRAISGSSLGRAALEARQAFVAQAGELDMVNLKTLAQFSLMGDPSIHAVAAPETSGTAIADSHSFARAQRRAQLKSMGAFLGTSKPVVTTSTDKGIAKGQRTTLEGIAKKAGMAAGSLRSFKVKQPAGRPRVKGKGLPEITSYLLLQGNRSASGDPRGNACIVAKVAGGKVRGYRVYFRR